MRPFIVIPTFNEAGNIKELLEQILMLHQDFNIIVVDDNSPDGTGKILDTLVQEDSRIHVIHRPYKNGLGTAYVAGFKDALAKGADLIFEMDADFSHRPQYLKDFLEASEKAVLVIGSRYLYGVRVEGWSFRRLMLSKLANIFVSRVMLRPVWDFTSGFRCYRREMLEVLDLDSIKSDGYAFQIEMIYLAYKHHFSVLEIPITFKKRASGYSKLSRKIAKEAFWLTLKCHAPFLEILSHIFFFLINTEDFFNRISRVREVNVEHIDRHHGL